MIRCFFVLSHTKSRLICPKCNMPGSLVEKISSNTISLPKRIDLKTGDKGAVLLRTDLITTMSEACRYAAKILALMQENIIKESPSSKEEDDLSVESFYGFFSSLIPHSKEEIKQFEARHISDDRIVKRIEQSESENLKKDNAIYERKKKNTEALPVNTIGINSPRIRLQTSNNKKVSRTSVTYLYGSILFATFFQLAKKHVLPIPPHPKLPKDLESTYYFHTESAESVYAAAICQVFRLLIFHVDARMRLDPWRWMDILRVKEEHGYRRASSFSKQYTALCVCKKCSNLKSNPPHLQLMKESKVYNHLITICEKCGENEMVQISKPITVNAIKKREYEIKQDLFFLEAYLYYFVEYMSFMDATKEALYPEFTQIFKDEFCRQEAEAMKFSFLKDRSWYMIHHDKKTNGKRSHYLNNGSLANASNNKKENENPIKKIYSVLDVKIKDPTYKELVRQISNASSEQHEIIVKLQSSIVKRLLNIGWPDGLIDLRIRNDIKLISTGFDPP